MTNQLRDMVRLIFIQNGGEDICGKSCISRILLRNLVKRLKIGRKFAHRRADMTSVETLKTWLGQFQDLVELYKIKPENIWNMDENGFFLGITDNQRIIRGTCTKCSL